MAMYRSREIAHRCMMDAVEKSTSRKSQMGQRNSGRGHPESENSRKKDIVSQGHYNNPPLEDNWLNILLDL